MVGGGRREEGEEKWRSRRLSERERQMMEMREKEKREKRNRTDQPEWQDKSKPRQANYAAFSFRLLFSRKKREYYSEDGEILWKRKILIITLPLSLLLTTYLPLLIIITARASAKDARAACAITTPFYSCHTPPLRQPIMASSDARCVLPRVVFMIIHVDYWWLFSLLATGYIQGYSYKATRLATWLCC